MKTGFLAKTTGCGEVLHIPLRFKTYEVDGVIETGSFAVVVKVRDVIKGEYFATKVMRRPKVNSEEMKLMEHELRLGRTLACPYLIRYIDVCYFDEIIVVVMELGKGKDLKSLLLEDQKTVAINWSRIFRQVCLGVQYLHKRGLAHRDLKPENILVDNHFNAKLCDYGLLCEVGKAENQGTRSGTVSYMAPEMAMSEKYCEKAADIWALGVTLFVMATGGLPFNVEYGSKAMQKMLGSEASLDMSPVCQRDLIVKCCEVDVNKRGTIDEIMPAFTGRSVSYTPSVDNRMDRNKRKKRYESRSAPGPRLLRPSSIIQMSPLSKLGPRMRTAVHAP